MGAYTRKDKEEIENTLRMVYDRFPRLEERKGQMAGTLSGGEQQMLAMGRALMSHPSIILMDEPSMGLSPILVRQFFLWNKMQKRHFPLQTVLMYSKQVKLS